MTKMKKPDMHVYETRHVVDHSAEDMFALVARVEDYAKFLPLCEGVHVKRREQRGTQELLVATMTVGYKFFRESFSTQVTLDEPARNILVEYLDGPFSRMENRWEFHPVQDHVCDVKFFIAYEFRSRTLGMLMGAMFDAAFRRFSAAFERRADAIYGRRTA